MTLKKGDMVYVSDYEPINTKALKTYSIREFIQMIEWQYLVKEEDVDDSIYFQSYKYAHKVEEKEIEWKVGDYYIEESNGEISAYGIHFRMFDSVSTAERRKPTEEELKKYFR